MGNPLKKIAKTAVKSAAKFTPSPGLNVTTRTATRIPGATRGKPTGYTKEFKSKYNNATNALFVGALGAGALASGGFPGKSKPQVPAKKPVVKPIKTKK